jgi:hypothetical protein
MAIRSCGKNRASHEADLNLSYAVREQTMPPGDHRAQDQRNLEEGEDEDEGESE